MKFPCTIWQQADGRWSARHAGSDVGQVEVLAATRSEAIEKLRGELRYRLELCPCSGDSYQHIEIEVVPA
jgi:hypothetical protein